MCDIRDVRLSEGVEWAIHVSTILAVLPPERTLPATRLAEFHGVPPAYLAKTMQALSRAGIVESVAGARGGYRLAKPAADIPVLDLVLAVDGDETAFRCTEIRQRGPAAQEPAAYTKTCGIARLMWSAEEAWRAVLRETSVADLLVQVAPGIPVPAVTATAVWIQEVSR